MGRVSGKVMSEARLQFLDTVRRALSSAGPVAGEAGEASAEHAVEEGSSDATPSVAGAEEASAIRGAHDLASEFVREARAAGARVHVLGAGAGRHGVRDALREIVAEERARSVVFAGGAGVPDLVAAAREAGGGIAWHMCDLRTAGSTRGELRELETAADIGIDRADHALADTGTLVFRHRPGCGRALSLLPPVHIAILDEDEIVPDIEALMKAEPPAGGPLPSALTFVTGPSRTADIEMVITEGVHGPGRVHILLISSGAAG